MSGVLVMAFAFLFVVNSCHTERFTSPLHFAEQNSCKEHTLSSFNGDIKFMDDAVLPSVSKSFLLALILAAFWIVFPPKVADLNARNPEMRKRNERLCWIWTKTSPFSRTIFLSYFAAQRDP